MGVAGAPMWAAWSPRRSLHQVAALLAAWWGVGDLATARDRCDALAEVAVGPHGPGPPGSRPVRRRFRAGGMWEIAAAEGDVAAVALDHFQAAYDAFGPDGRAGERTSLRFIMITVGWIARLVLAPWRRSARAGPSRARRRLRCDGGRAPGVVQRPVRSTTRPRHGTCRPRHRRVGGHGRRHAGRRRARAFFFLAEPARLPAVTCPCCTAGRRGRCPGAVRRAVTGADAARVRARAVGGGTPLRGRRRSSTLRRRRLVARRRPGRFLGAVVRLRPCACTPARRAVRRPRRRSRTPAARGRPGACWSPCWRALARP